VQDLFLGDAIDTEFVILEKPFLFPATRQKA
jgi:hypothetical protein